MKVIETYYNGHKFRSRLEARWAVFMDAMGVEYEYEREGYELDGECYLPDFWLPLSRVHLEIKPVFGSESDGFGEKYWKLARFTDRPVLVLYGPPAIPELGPGENSTSAIIYLWNKDGETPRSRRMADDEYWWCECPKCGRCELQFNGRADRIKCDCKKSEHGDKGYNYDSPRLVQAYLIARSFRFEKWRPSDRIATIRFMFQN